MAVKPWPVVDVERITPGCLLNELLGPYRMANDFPP